MISRFGEFARDPTTITTPCAVKKLWNVFRIFKSARLFPEIASKQSAYGRNEMPHLPFFVHMETEGLQMRNYLFVAAVIGAFATPAMAEDVGVGVRAGPVGGGVTVGETHDMRDRDRTTVIKEREPRDTDRTTVIKKQNEDGSREKTVIHHDND